MFNQFFQQIINFLGGLVDWCTRFLPLSPFMQVKNLTLSSELMAAIGWFVPFSSLTSLFEVWAVSILGWYAINKVLRFAKMIS